MKHSTRIQELQLQMKNESATNFPNENLWNELNDKVENLQMFGQENSPEDIVEDDLVVGRRLNNGEETWFEGMSVSCFNKH